LVAVAFVWTEHHGVTLQFIKPACRCRMVSTKDSIAATVQVLDLYAFGSLNEAREQAEKWPEG
jgi:hypothetical protein